MPAPASENGRSANTGFFLVLAILVLAAAQKQVVSNTLDPDVFWHIRVGGQLLRDGIGPLIDDFSYCSITLPWTPYSWLGELLLHWTWRVGGLRGSVILGAALVGSVVAMLA